MNADECRVTSGAGESSTGGLVSVCEVIVEWVCAHCTTGPLFFLATY